MKAVVLFALLLVGVCALAGASKHHGDSRVLASRFAELDEIKRLNPKHRQLVERAVRAFENVIDESKLDPTHKEAAKQKAMDHFMSRLADRKHGH